MDQFIHSTKETILPVRPPTLFNAPPIPCTAPATAGPATEVTLARPSDAFAAASLALAADSAVVEACLNAGRRTNARDCRRSRRDGAVTGIVETGSIAKTAKE